MLTSFRLNWPVEIVGFERREVNEQDNEVVYTQTEAIAAQTTAEYNNIAYADSLEDQDITHEQRQMMYRWLAVAAVMRTESDSTHLVCATMPFTRRWMKPCNYIALVEVLSNIHDRNGDTVPVFLSRGNGNQVLTREFQ